MAISPKARRNLWLLLGLCVLVPCACRDDTEATDVVAGNSWLAACVKDLSGPDTPVMCLAEPGSCPGHAALRPSQGRALRNSTLLLRFDFQQGLDETLSGAVENGLNIVAVKPAGGMCNPRAYQAGCEQVAQAMQRASLLDPRQARQRIEAISRRMERLLADSRQRIEQAGLAGAAVLVSPHQKDFCQVLGLEVAGTFIGADQVPISAVLDSIRAGREQNVRLVIANRPEGDATARSLAQKLGVKMVVFDNFPDPGRGIPGIDEMVQANVGRLIEASR
jgi:ABC-type Zn uptake system ZnuABC Zn-binding protein ZnuA